RLHERFFRDIYVSHPEHVLKKISEELSSLHVTTWILIILFLWFSWCILLAGPETFSTGFHLMNSTHLHA
ncbi:MAG: hypothetical protein B1H11_09125, partial [Desulfobacteraceae bacterium 4484_190.1]